VTCASRSPGGSASSAGPSGAVLATYRVPTTEEEAANFATEIKSLLDDQGFPVPAPEVYFLPEGRQTTPISVLPSAIFR